MLQVNLTQQAKKSTVYNRLELVFDTTLCERTCFKQRNVMYRELDCICCDINMNMLRYKLHFVQVRIWFNLNHSLGKFSRRQIGDIFFLFFPENRICHLMQIFSMGNNFHEMTNSVFWERWENISIYRLLQTFTQSRYKFIRFNLNALIRICFNL